MPYNTRRKSLSLPSLGIQLPPGSRAHQSSSKTDQPSNKKVKRSHSPLTNAITYEPTPPLSPPPETSINYAEINDEIISGVVSILETTGNRPHTVKELAAVLAPSIVLVETSVNPQAIISSRLTNYLRRTHTRSPCLLKKELVSTHPKRLYFYLATCPRQPFPKYENDFFSRTVVSPAPSEDEGDRHREDSPEVDLSSHELDDGEDEDSDSPDSLSSTAASVIARDRTRSPSEFNPRNPMASAPLEGDEREFSQSAINLGRRSMSQQGPINIDLKRARDEFDADGDDDAAAASLLGYQPVGDVSVSTILSTRVKQEDNSDATHAELTIKTDFYSNWGGELERHLGSPEAIDLDELDTLLDF